MNSFLTLKGTLAERNRQQGQHFKSILNQLIQEIRTIPLTQRDIRFPLFLYKMGLPLIGHHYLKKHRPLLNQNKTNNYEEALNQLAQGFEVSPSLLYGFQAFEPLSSKLPYTLGCCALTITSQASTLNKPLLAYNHDFPEAFGSFLFLKKNICTDAYTNLALGYPPLMGAIAGINEHGLCVSLNHAYATDVTSKASLAPTLIVQRILNECKNISEAVQLGQSVTATNGSLITLMDLQENRAVIEVSANRQQIRIPQKPIEATFNQYQTKFMQEIEIPLNAQGTGIYSGHLIHEHSIKRQNRFKTLLAEQNSPVSPKQIHSWLSDHDQKGGDFFTICRHHPKTASTLTSIIISPRDLTIDVIWGKPCQGAYQTYSLTND